MIDPQTAPEGFCEALPADGVVRIVAVPACRGRGHVRYNAFDSRSGALLASAVRKPFPAAVGALWAAGEPEETLLALRHHPLPYDSSAPLSLASLARCFDTLDPSSI